MPPSPPPADLPPPQAGLPPALGSVSIGSVLAALAELNVKVSIEDLLKAIHDQERARITAQLRAVSLQLSLQRTGPTVHPNTSTASNIDPFPPLPPYDDPSTIGYRRFRLSKFAKENPVSGEVKPFTPAGLRLPEDVATSKPVAWCNPTGDKPAPR